MKFLYRALLILLPIISFAQESDSVDESFISEIMSFEREDNHNSAAKQTPEIQYNLARVILSNKEKNIELAYQLLKMSADAGYGEAARLLKTLN